MRILEEKDEGAEEKDEDDDKENKSEALMTNKAIQKEYNSYKSEVSKARHFAINLGIKIVGGNTSNGCKTSFVDHPDDGKRVNNNAHSQE